MSSTFKRLQKRVTCKRKTQANRMIKRGEWLKNLAAKNRKLKESSNLDHDEDLDFYLQILDSGALSISSRNVNDIDVPLSNIFNNMINLPNPYIIQFKTNTARFSSYRTSSRSSTSTIMTLIIY